MCLGLCGFWRVCHVVWSTIIKRQLHGLSQGWPAVMWFRLCEPAEPPATLLQALWPVRSTASLSAWQGARAASPMFARALPMLPSIKSYVQRQTARLHPFSHWHFIQGKMYLWIFSMSGCFIWYKGQTHTSSVRQRQAQTGFRPFTPFVRECMPAGERHVLGPVAAGAFLMVH